MCDAIRAGLHNNISVEFERLASLRATEVVIVNRGLDGQDRMGLRLVCYDNGVVRDGYELIDEIDIV